MDGLYYIFSAHYLPHVGGVERYTDNLARKLAAGGNRVVIITSNPGNQKSRETVGESIEVLRIPSRQLMGGRYPVPRRGGEWEKELAALERQTPDGIIINTRFYPLSLIGAQMAARMGVVPVVVEHGSAHLTAGSPLADPIIEAVEHSLTRKMKSYGGRFYAVSQAGCRWLDHFGIDPCGVLSNAIDAEAFRASASQRDFRAELGIGEDVFAVAFVGRLAPEKGIEALARAASLLAERGDIAVIAAGDGPLAAKLRADLPPNMHLCGPLEPSDVSALLRTCDGFCMPTRSEGFATALLEAAAWECAPVITDVGGVAELIPGRDFGIVLKDAQPQTVAKALASLADDRDGARAMGRRIRQREEALFTWDKTAEALIEACRAAQRETAPAPEAPHRAHGLWEGIGKEASANAAEDRAEPAHPKERR